MATDIKYPDLATNDVSIPFWLRMVAHESKSNLSGENSTSNDDVYGNVIETILLQAPQSIISSDGHRWGQLDSGLITAAKKTMEGGGGDFLETITGLGKKVLENTFGDVGKEALRALGDRTAQNPFTEKMYEAPEFRTFTFAWEFAAETSIDAKKLRDCIDAIRRLSYPSRSADANNDLFRYKFPSEWKLELLELSENGTIRPYGRMGKSVLTNMSTNYTGAGVVSGFNKDETYSPFVNLELTFSETNLNHKDSGNLLT